MGGDAQGLLNSLLGFAGEFAGARVRVAVKTNLGPEFDAGEINLGASSGGGGGANDRGVSGLLGIKAAVILRRQDGSVVATFGEPPPTEPLRLILLAALAGGVLLLILRGVRRAR